MKAPTTLGLPNVAAALCRASVIGHLDRKGIIEIMPDHSVESGSTQGRTVASILGRYPDGSPTQVLRLDNAGGFSGARLWKVSTARGEVCVRQWPFEHPSAPQLRWIHKVLRFVHAKGCTFVPVPWHSLQGESFVHFEGQLWEVTPWMPGIADFLQHPSDQKLQAAMQALACFHLASAQLQTQKSKSLGLEARAELASQWLRTDWRDLVATARSYPDPDLGRKLEHVALLARPRVQQIPELVRPHSRKTLVLQPCLRDIWHDHLLFTGQEVTGIVDFGAMRIETVAGDLARLLGSLVGSNEQQRQLGLAAYASLRPLADEERSLVDVFDQANVALSGLNWLRWILLEHRTFGDRLGVLRRLDAILARLQDN